VIEKRKKTNAMTKRVKMARRSDNVFLDLGFPEVEARNLLLRMQIMICIEQFVKRSGLTRARAAARLGLTQPELNAFLFAKIDQFCRFSLDALVNMATRAGLHVELHVTPAKRAAGRVAATA
jgi:predicted XRE-type DNA-binding protein